MKFETLWDCKRNRLHGDRQKFFQGTKSKFLLFFSGSWRWHENGRSQNALPFLSHKENSTCCGLAETVTKLAIRWENLSFWCFCVRWRAV